MSMTYDELLERFREKIEKQLDELDESYKKIRDEELSKYGKFKNSALRRFINNAYDIRSYVIRIAKVHIEILESELLMELLNEDMDYFKKRLEED